MTENTQYIVQLQLIGNNVDKVISIGVSPDEFINLDRAEKIGMKLVKRVEIVRETTLVSQPEQSVATPTPQPEQRPETQHTAQETTTIPETPETPQKFGRPTQISDIFQKKSNVSDDTVDSLITQPNAKPEI